MLGLWVFGSYVDVVDSLSRLFLSLRQAEDQCPRRQGMIA